MTMAKQEDKALAMSLVRQVRHCYSRSAKKAMVSECLLVLRRSLLEV